MNFSNKANMGILLLSFFCVFALTTCAVRTPVERVSISEVQKNLKYQNIIFKEFKSASHVVNPEFALIQCKVSAISYLNGKDIFKRIERVEDIESEEEDKNPYDESTLFVKVELTDLRILHGAARTWGGVTAGRSHMIMDVKLTDASTGSLIAQKELFGAPSAFGAAWTFGASDRNLPSNMGILLGDFILANVSGK